jgi:hypothetical protein
MDKEWMYKTSRLDPSYLEHVTKFIAATKRHRLGLKREHTVCPCKSYKNLLLHEDNMVISLGSVWFRQGLDHLEVSLGSRGSECWCI